jgi:hypothetical protein
MTLTTTVEELGNVTGTDNSVADPDPEPDRDPYVLGPPGSRCRSISTDPDPSIIK